MHSKRRRVSAVLLGTLMLAGLTSSIMISAGEPVTVAVLRQEGDELVLSRVDAANRADAERLVASLQSEPGVVAASIPNKVSNFKSNDPNRSQQWGLDRLEVDNVRPHASGDGVTVAVVDSGVDGSHPDLSHAVLPGYDVIGDSDGRVDPNGHGTHVAGIIAAAENNGIGVAGLAPDVNILPVRALDETGYGDDAGIAEGVLWAADHGADIINLSLGSTEKDPVLAAAVDSVVKRGILVVAASGNDGFSGSPTSYPAALPGVLAVGASSFGDQKAIFSTMGDYVGIAAPGVSIMSTWPGGYSYSSGTSMASPYVAAAAALVEQKTGLRGTALKDRLTSSATDAGDSGKDASFGYGIVDPLAALTDGKPRPPQTNPGSPGLPTLPQLPELTMPELPELTMPELPELTMPGKPSLPTPSLPGPGQPLKSLQREATLTKEEAGKAGQAQVKLAIGKVTLGKRTLEVQTQSGGTWVTSETVTTDAFGRASFPVAGKGSQARIVFDGDRIAKATELVVTLP